MKHLAAYLLLGLGGNTSPSAADVTAVLESVGIEADEDRLDTLIKELKGKDINEVRDIPTMTADRASRTNVRDHSSSLRALPSSPPFPAVAVAVLLLVVLPLAAPLLRLPRRRRRKRRRRSLMTTWDSVSSTKHLPELEQKNKKFMDIEGVLRKWSTLLVSSTGRNWLPGVLGLDFRQGF